MKRAGFSRLVVFKLKETWALLNGDRRRGGPRRRKGRWAWAKVKLVGVDTTRGESLLGGLAFLWEARREVSGLPPGGLTLLPLNKLRLRQGQFQEPEV